MKKALSILLAAVMCLGLGTAAMAADDPYYNVRPFEDEEWAYSSEYEYSYYNYGDEYVCFAYYDLDDAAGEKFGDFKVSVKWKEGKEYVEEIGTYKYDYVSSDDRDVDLGIKFKDAYPEEPVRIRAEVKFMTTKGKNVTDRIYNGYYNDVYDEICEYDEDEKVITVDFLYGFNKDVEMYMNRLIDEDGYIEYEDFDNYYVDNGYVYFAPVLDFDKFEDEAGVSAKNLFMTFDGTGVAFETKLVKQAPVNMYYDTAAHKPVVDKYEEFDMEFMNFKAKPEFDFTGVLTWYVPDEEQEWYLYEIGEDGSLKETKAVFDEDEGCFTLKARTLGNYVIMTGEAEIEKEEEKENPETGAAFSAAVALAALAK
jgi:hypothetical protein